MKNRLVAITGLGAVAPNGVGVEAFWNSLIEGVSGVNEMTLFDKTAFRSPLAAEVKELTFPYNVSRLCFMAETAVSEAIKMSGLGDDISGNRTAVILGTVNGGIFEGEKCFLDGNKNIDGKRDYPNFSASVSIARKYSISGSNFTVNTACASGTTAIGMAMELIVKGKADIVIAGGVETLSRFILSGFNSLFIATTDNIRPYDLNRSGFAVGEGCGIVILENEESAKKRNANILGIVSGYASSSDAVHLTGVDREGKGLGFAITSALDDSGLNIDDIDFISGHGTATRQNDLGETLAIKLAFGKKAYHTPISSIKSMIGHTMGAAGALEAVAMNLSLRKGIIPPTINYCEKDPLCDLDYVPNCAREIKADKAVSVSSGFTGHNGVLVMENYRG